MIQNFYFPLISALPSFVFIYVSMCLFWDKGELKIPKLVLRRYSLFCTARPFLEVLNGPCSAGRQTQKNTIHAKQVF